MKGVLGFKCFFILKTIFKLKLLEKHEKISHTDGGNDHFHHFLPKGFWRSE